MRLIDANALKREINKGLGLSAETREMFCNFLDYAPTVEPDEVYMTGENYNLYLEGYKDAKREIEDPKWVDSNEQLPQYSGLYLVSIGELVTTANFDGAVFRNRGMMQIDVDAWQILPKSFKTIGDSKNDRPRED